MTTLIGEDCSILIPSQFCEADAIEAGQTCEIERLGKGEYRLRLTEPREPRSLIELLRACPVKDFFVPLPRTETTSNYVPFTFDECSIFATPTCSQNRRGAGQCRMFSTGSTSTGRNG